MTGGLELDTRDLAPSLFLWPPAKPVPKSTILRFLANAAHLRAVPTSACHPEQTISLPACIKPDIGTLGIGFRAIATLGEWRSFLETHPEPAAFVVQPFLMGTETRTTLCANGTYASAELLERVETRSRWRDSTSTLAVEWLDDLGDVLGQIATQVIGVDIIDANGVAYLLDINVAPALAVHLVTQTPRNLAAAVLDSWLSSRPNGRRS